MYLIVGSFSAFIFTPRVESIHIIHPGVIVCAQRRSSEPFHPTSFKGRRNRMEEDTVEFLNVLEVFINTSRLRVIDIFEKFDMNSNGMIKKL